MVRAMKIKSHSFISALALVAAAVFTLTTANTAQARLRGSITPDPYITPAPAIEPAPAPRIEPGPRIQPLPPMPAPINSGTFNGTVMD